MTSANAALGIPCATCKRRRVKCDSTQPLCLRCQKDGRECSGYDPYRWVSMHPGKRKDRTAKSSSRSPKESTDGSGTTVVLHETALVHRNQRLPSPYPAIPRFDMEGEKRCWSINDSIQYCNNHVVPDLIPYPFARTYFMNPDEWRRAPSLLHSIVLVLVANHRIVRQISDGSAVSDLYKYRGDALRELAEKINSSEKLSTIIALIGVLMVLQTEIQLSAISSWDLHLRAARAFICQLGGIVKCWNDLPHLRMLLSLHFLVEIMSPITTPTSLLSEQELREADEDVIRVPGIEKNLLASCCPLPLPIITAITQINRLRGGLRSETDTDSVSRSECQRDTVARFASVLQQLDKFDPEAWATRVIAEFPDDGMYTERSMPQFNAMELSEWTATGQCYQSSITIYLLRSASSYTRSAEDASLEQSTTTATKRLQAEAYTLGTALDQLFLYFGDRRSTSLRPGLWRFTMFPLFIHALELLVWQQPGPPEKAQRHYLDRMRSLGQALGCRAMDSAVECVERAVRLKKHRGRAPEWDECFTSRAIFVI